MTFTLGRSFFKSDTMVKAVELEKSYKLLNHGPTVLVSAAHGDQRNVMAAAWSMPLDFSPPKLCVVIESSSFTRQLVDAEGSFALNVPTRLLADTTLQVGHCTGSEIDKFAKFKIETFPASQIRAPLISGCVGWLECKVIREERNEKNYDLFIAEIVAAWADTRAFENGRWKKLTPDLQTLHYIAGGAFFLAADTLEIDV